MTEKKYSYAYVKGIVVGMDYPGGYKAKMTKYSVDILPQYEESLYVAPSKSQTYRIDQNDVICVSKMPVVGDEVILRSLLTKACPKFNPMKAMIVKEVR